MCRKAGCWRQFYTIVQCVMMLDALACFGVRQAQNADEQMMRLSDVMALTPGSRIVLNTAIGAPVLVRCGAVPLFEGRVGRRKSRIAVRIERDLPRPQQPTER